MVANLGYGALVITLLVSLYGIGAAYYGARTSKHAWIASARNATLLTFPLITVSALSIIYLLVTNDYQVDYVASVTSNSMPFYLKVTALWGGQPGSLVFWSWLMAAFASAVTLRKWDRDQEFLPWVVIVTLVTLGFFVSLNVFFENPFLRLWQTTTGGVTKAMLQPAGSVAYVPMDGSGLNPLLRHPGMIIHPPMLYLGFVAFVIPYAFAIAALVTGRTDDRWIRITRRWTLVAWLFLSLGLILGGRWAYDVLGWGGYWGWDPVEIAAFMPWLTGTAFLHSVMIQEKRGMLKHWNMILIILTYELVIFGTFLTRSGVLSSVHAFAQSAIGPVFFAFMGLTFIVSLSLLLKRWNDLKAKTQMSSLLSREALFLLNNLLFMGILVVCFWGVIFPLISEIFTGQKVTVGPPFYERATGPLFAGLLLLMGVAPLAAWRHSSAKTLGRAMWKPFIASLVILVVVLVSGVRSWAALLGFWLSAFVALVTLYEFELFQTETQGTISRGEQISLGDYTVTFDSLSVFDTQDGRNVARAVMSVDRNGRTVGELYPRRDYYYESQQPMTIPGVRSTWEDDFYILLVDWQPISSAGATFKIYHNPLVNWLWLGGFVFILGTLVAAWPDRDPEKNRVSARSSSYATAKA